MRRTAALVVTLAVVLALPGLGAAVGEVMSGPPVDADRADSPDADRADLIGGDRANSTGDGDAGRWFDGESADGATEDGATDGGSNGTVRVGPGSQIATVLAATEDEVGAAVSRSAFDARFAAANESERARLVANRSAALRATVDEVLADYAAATAAFRNGTTNRSTFAQRLAAIESRADAAAARVDHLQRRAANVSALELAAAGFDGDALDAAAADLGAVSGAEPSALLRRFTGRTGGEVRVGAGDGVSIEVGSEDGERARELRRPGDGNDSLTVPQSEALATARAALSNGSADWTLREASVRPAGGYHEFEFARATANETGEAEVRVDGSSGTVVRLEAEVGAVGADDQRPGPDDRPVPGNRSEGDPPTNESERGERGPPNEGGPPSERGPPNERTGESDDPNLALLVVDGVPAPGATLTLEARQDDAPVANVTVWVDGTRVGSTDRDGRVTATLGTGGTEIRAERGDAAAELEFEFERESPVTRDLNVSTALDDGVASLGVEYDGEGVPGVQVALDGERVGATGPDGTAAFDVDADAEAVELSLTKGEFEYERTYRVADGALVPTDDETERGSERGDDREGPERGDRDDRPGEGERERSDDRQRGDDRERGDERSRSGQGERAEAGERGDGAGRDRS